MANRLNPTAANIISSLGVKGATATEPLEGYVPILGPDGKLSVEFIPNSAAKMSVPPISDVAFVDPYTEERDADLRNGSIAAPCKYISEAASKFSTTDGDRVAIVLSPGVYNDSQVSFGSSIEKVYLIGLGRCYIDVNGGSFSISVGQGVDLTVQNIDVPTTMSVSAGTTIRLVGNTHINELLSSNSTIVISAEARVESTNASTIQLASDSAHVSNTSSVQGKTVGDAIERLGGRKIRILRIDAGSSGVDFGSSFEDIEAESSGSDDIYDLRGRDSSIASALSELFRRSKHIVADDVSAGIISADSISTRSLSIDALKIGGYNIEVDAYGYLVVGTGSAIPVRPTAGTVLLRDTVTGGLWILYVENGRLYVERFYEDSSDSSTTYEEYDFIELVDALDTYRVSMSDGRLVIDEGSSN